MLEELSLVLNITGSPDLVSSSAGALHGAEGDMCCIVRDRTMAATVCVWVCVHQLKHTAKNVFLSCFQPKYLKPPKSGRIF